MAPANDNLNKKTPAAGIVDRVLKIIYAISAVVLVCLMLLVAADVGLRTVFNFPILGTVELTEILMLMLVFFGMVYTQVRKGHVGVDALISRFPKRTQAIIQSITTLASIVLFLVISWQSVMRAEQLRLGNYLSPVWHIPSYPFVYFAVIAAAVIAVLLVFDLIKHFKQATLGMKPQVQAGIAILVVAVLIAIFIPLWGQDLFTDIDPFMAGVFFTTFMIILMFSGMPVGFVMALAGFLGTLYVTGLPSGLAIMGVIPSHTAASYNNSVIPLFVLMGALCFSSGISQDLYQTAHKWLGRLPGGLAMATVGACAGFAAVSGSGAATAATIGAVSIPEMRRYRYDPALATGCVAAGGGIGVLIPPSIPMVIYGILTETSIGKLFLAGFIPGILQAVFYIVTIYILCRRNPNLGPPGPSVPLKEKFVALKNTWTVILLFLVVIGGIYMGVFTPTEAAGIGSFAALVIALSRRKLSWHSFNDSLADTAKTTGMIFILIIGGTIYGHFLSVTRLPFELSSIVSGLEVNRYIILGIVILIYLFLGCIMSSLAMIIITVPIFFPIITALGFDPIWFGIIIVRMVEVGAITPPVGIHVFILQGIASDVPQYTIFRGIIPFLIADFFHIALLILLPQVVTFLPELMH